MRAGAVRVEHGAVAQFAEPGSAARAQGAGVVVSWLPSVVTRLSASYDITQLDRAQDRLEHALILRVQQGF